MNKNILHATLAGAIALAMAGCSENSWNDHFLEGFDGEVNYDKAEKGTYTLTSENYEDISKSLQSVATDAAEKAAAKAIATNLCFDKSSIYPAQQAMLQFLTTSSFPYYLAGNGTSVDITYDECDAAPAELTALQAAKTYTLKAADYQQVWGSTTAFISSFAPDKSVADCMPAFLADKYADAESGTYAVITYNVATENPEFEIKPGGLTATPFSGAFAAGKYFIADVAGARVAAFLAADKTYGYLPSNGVSVDGTTLIGVETASQQWEFKAAANDGEYYMLDGSGRYYYMSGTYNSFNVSATPKDGDEGYLWTVAANADGTYTITNKGKSKTLQVPTTYDTWGAYPNPGTNPMLYVEGEMMEPAAAPSFTPESTAKTTLYYFNGSKWAPATGIMMLEAADYTAMGFTNNKLTDADVYIPMWLKLQKPYALDGDMEYVVYNGNKAGLFVFDGSSWTLNDNGRETVTGRFTKKNGAWAFEKYVGKAIYNLFEEDQIIMNRTYLIADGSNCATPVPASSNYGYLLATSIQNAGGTVVMNSDANGFTFADNATVNDNVMTAPEGYFLIRDTNERYLYLSGTYNSFNVTAAPGTTDGALADNYLWKATYNQDGTWTIVNKSNGKTMFYSTKYSNVAAYDKQSENDHLPTLFLLEE